MIVKYSRLRRPRPGNVGFVSNGIYSGLRNFTFAFEYLRIQVAHSKFFALASYARKLAPLYRKIP